MTIESDGSDIKREFGSKPKAPAMGSGLDPGILGNVTKTTQDFLKFKTPGDTNWGSNPNVAPEKKVKGEKNAQGIAVAEKDSQVPKTLKSTNPTMASAPMMEVLDAVKQADPKNIVGAVKKALDAMMMLKQISKLTSPAGIIGMASGAMGGAFQEIAGAFGMQGALGMFNQCMPDMMNILPPSQISALNSGLVGMINQQAVGFLHPDIVNAAMTTQSVIAAATNSDVVNDIIMAAATIGGPSLGLDPTTLAGRIATAVVGSTIVEYEYINGVQVKHELFVQYSNIQDQLGNIPSLTGTEHVVIPMQYQSPMAQDIATMIRNVGGIAGVTAPLLSNLISNSVANLADQGLSKILGSGIDGLLGNVTSLLPNIAGNITGVISSLNLPNMVINSGNITKAMQETTKILAIGKMSFKIADMFGAAMPEEVTAIKDALGAAVSVAAAGSQLNALVNGVNVRSTNMGDKPLLATTAGKIMVAGGLINVLDRVL